MYGFRLIQVYKTFNGNEVLKGLNLSVEQGERILVIGGSGAGKSVLLKLLCGLMKPDRGRVFLWDAEVSALQESELVPVRRRIGVLFQGCALFDSLSVFENVAFPLREHGGFTEEQIRHCVEEKLRAVGLPQVGERAPAELSGGMRKRVALARAVVQDPEIVLYDEPTTGLDPANAKRISFMIRRLHDSLHCTTCVVTHDMACAKIIGGRYAFLANGVILTEGPMEEIEKAPQKEVRSFLEYEGGAW